MAIFNETSVSLHHAEGIPGRLVNQNPAVYTTLNYVCGGVVPIAGFCWLDNDGRIVAAGSGQPLGFVTNLYDAYITSIDNTQIFELQENWRSTVLRKGDVWCQTATVPARGQKVFANLATGVATTAAAGATVSGAIETSFVVDYVSPDSGNLFIMTNLDPVIVPTEAA